MKFWFVLGLTLIFSSCKDSCDEVGNLNGNWRQTTGGTVFNENWGTFENGTISGSSFMTVDGDTVFKEEMAIHTTDSGTYYVVRIPDQNNDQKVSFKLTSSSDKKLVFENKRHDFPKLIEYTFAGHDSLYAKVSGIEDGKYQELVFAMERK